MQLIYRSTYYIYCFILHILQIHLLNFRLGTAAQAVDFWPGPEDLHSWTWNQYRKYVTQSLDSFEPRVSQLTLQLYNSSNIYGKNGPI